eukprot:gene28183-31280_t
MAAAVHLSHKYIANRLLPDKAIDLLDKAGSKTLEIKEHAVSEERYEYAYKAWLREETFRRSTEMMFSNPREELVLPSMDGPALLPLVTVSDIYRSRGGSKNGHPSGAHGACSTQWPASQTLWASSLKQCIVCQDEAVNI